MLTGPLPPEIGGLVRVTRLSLCANALEGDLPPELGRLTRLRQLYLCRNGFSGPLPPEIGDMRALQHVNFAVNRLTGEMPGSMVSLRRMQSLNWAINDGLCAPVTERFMDWLDGLIVAKGDRCAADVGGLAGDLPGAGGAADGVSCTVMVADGRAAGPAPRATEPPGQATEPAGGVGVTPRSVSCAFRQAH